MEQTNKTTNFSQALLWLGAAISIAEILTGALIAPLGLEKGIFAILLGHIIGCVILYFSGFIGAKSKLSAIESTRISFGQYGSYVFSILNILQLVGWTAVMIINGAKAFDVVTKTAFGFQNEVLWSILIGALICVWIIVGIKNLTKINIIAVGGLFIFTIILGWVVFFSNAPNANEIISSISFGAAVELSVIMPLSWLPLISDYTRNLKNEKSGTLVSAVSYSIGSTFMYVIGLGAALFAGTSDISAILIAAGLSFIALVIVLFSTVTTTFLDVYSAAVSFVNISRKSNEKLVSILVCVIGVIIALSVPTTQYESFLYLIGSAFAPLFAIMITDFFILKNNTLNSSCLFNMKNSVIWVIGVILYRLLMNIDTPIGSTLPTMLLVALICIIVNKGVILCSKKS
ncbi:MAG: putative hydroxymethylpyrimidine transporter CytX [Clostridia bacterium]